MTAPISLLTPAFFGLPHGSELIIVLILVLIIFGPKQLPKIGRALGGGIKEFKDGLKVGSGDDEEEEESKEPPTRTTVQAHPPEALPPHGSGEPQAPTGEPADKPQQSSQP